MRLPTPSLALAAQGPLTPRGFDEEEALGGAVQPSEVASISPASLAVAAESSNLAAAAPAEREAPESEQGRAEPPDAPSSRAPFWKSGYPLDTTPADAVREPSLDEPEPTAAGQVAIETAALEAAAQETITLEVAVVDAVRALEATVQETTESEATPPEFETVTTPGSDATTLDVAAPDAGLEQGSPEYATPHRTLPDLVTVDEIVQEATAFEEFSTFGSALRASTPEVTEPLPVALPPEEAAVRD